MICDQPKQGAMDWDSKKVRSEERPSATVTRRTDAMVVSGDNSLANPQEIIEQLSFRQLEIEVQNEELQEAQRRLKIAKKQFQDLWNRAPIGYFTHLEDGVIISANAKAASLLDLEEHSFGTVNIWSRVATGSYSDYFQHVQRSLNTDGSTSSEIQFNVGTRSIWCRLETEHARGHAIQTALVDITREKEQEASRLQLEQQLRQAQKMELLSRLSGSLAHDFSNLLQAIFVQAEIGRTACTDESDLCNSFDNIMAIAERGSVMNRRLLSFSRQKTSELERVDLVPFVRQSAQLLEPVLGEQIDLRVQANGPPLWIQADTGQLDQVLLNLCVNSSDAMKARGILGIAVEQVQLEQARPTMSADLPAGHYARLSVGDSGPGIMGNAKLLFEPFFTTKPDELGTGLGLAIVDNIITSHGGAICVGQSQWGGANFEIYLPLL